MYHMQRSPRKRTSKISEAVFRGRRSFYSFEVFPLTAKDIEDAAGVFIISRRRTDKFGSGHHATICVGETRSILAEIRRHKRAKCVKQTAANVVCFLREEKPETRLGVVEDLVSSRTFNCVRNEIRTAIKPRPAIVEFKPEPRRRRVVPAEPSAEEAGAAKKKAATSKAKPKTKAASKAKPRTNSKTVKKTPSAAKKAVAKSKTPPKTKTSSKVKPAKPTTKKRTAAAAPRSKRAAAKPVAKDKPVARKSTFRKSPAATKKRAA